MDKNSLADKNISIIGTGLMGGSILKALKDAQEQPKSVTAYDIDTNTLQEIQKAQLADFTTDDAKVALNDADLIVICLYPKLAAKFIKDNMQNFKSGSIVTDICGVKREIYNLLNGYVRDDIYFVGGHPMAGKEDQGYHCSTPDLFLGCKYLVTDGKSHAVEIVCKFAKMLGADKIVITDCETHDEMIAYTSQLAHVLSVSYMLCAKNRNVLDFSAGSFRDMTRVAMINDKMWSELFLENKDKLTFEIDSLIESLSTLRNHIDTNNEKDLRKAMQQARSMKETIV